MNHHRSSAEAAAAAERWDLRLYVAGQTDKSIRAIANLSRICKEHLEGHYTIEVIDLMTRASPPEIKFSQSESLGSSRTHKKIIGDLSNEERVLIGLDIRPRGPT